MDERDLLHQFTASASHDAFAQLVRANIDLVYSAARRQISDPGLAEDVTQAVFIILAKKAGTIRGTVAGWLVRTTYLACKDARRMAARRDFHERRAMRSEVQTPTDPPPWEIFSPLIDEALAQLSDVDRDVITLRYLKNLSLREVAAAQKTTEEAARKRVDRAIARLRALLATKSAPPDANALGALLLAQMIHPAPAALATTILAGGVAAAAPALLAKSVMDLITWLKLKMALTLIFASIILAGAGAICTWVLLQKRDPLATAATSAPVPTAPAGPLTLEGLPILSVNVETIDPAFAAQVLSHVSSKAGARFSRDAVDADVKAIAQAGLSNAQQAQVIPVENPDHTWRGVNIRFILTQNAASAPGTAPALSNFQGWIHEVTDDGKGHTGTRDWDTQSRAFADRDDSGVRYMSPLTRENSEYRVDTNTLVMSYLAPEEEDDIRSEGSALTFTETLAVIRAKYDKANAVQVDASTDRGMKKFDLTLTDPSARERFRSPGSFYSRTPPVTFWADPATDRVMEIQDGRGRSTLTYGTKPIANIFEAGAPKTAQLWDCRPAPETMAVFNRMMARMEQGLPDGVLVTVILNSSGKVPDTGVEVYEIVGTHWIRRDYSSSPPHPAPLAVPDDWTGKGADELFHQFAITWPRGELTSDGETAWDKELDPKTGEAFFSWGSISQGEKMEMLKMPAGRKITGWDARFAVSNEGPMQFLYPKESFMGVYFTGNSLDLQTDPGRAGLIAFHVTAHGDSPDGIVGEHTFWIDPNHADRPVHEEETYYRDPKVRTLTSRTTTDFSDYFQLPDGRWLPGASTHTQEFPVHREIQKRTFHFFPNRTLPPLPQPTGTTPP